MLWVLMGDNKSHDAKTLGTSIHNAKDLSRSYTVESKKNNAV
jgi:hypothetical protein